MRKLRELSRLTSETERVGPRIRFVLLLFSNNSKATNKTNIKK